jgi:hypothetical protein
MITGGQTDTVARDQDGHTETAGAADGAAPRPAVAGTQWFLNCSRCGLSIPVRFTWLRPEHCPRCLARARVAHPMFQSPLPFSQLAARAPAVKGPHDHRCADSGRHRAA